MYNESSHTVHALRGPRLALPCVRRMPPTITDSGMVTVDEKRTSAASTAWHRVPYGAHIVQREPVWWRSAAYFCWDGEKQTAPAGMREPAFRVRASSAIWTADSLNPTRLSAKYHPTALADNLTVSKIYYVVMNHGFGDYMITLVPVFGQRVGGRERSDVTFH